ncbi:MAG: methylmalonyl Co-A mutase-associated GTPase MeaB, partial [Boseongicola sp.]
RLLRKRDGDAPGFPKATTISAQEETGLVETWSEIESLAKFRRDSGFWDTRRASQARKWFADEVDRGLMARLTASPRAEAAMASLGDAVASGERSPGAAAAEVLRQLSPESD